MTAQIPQEVEKLNLHFLMGLLLEYLERDERQEIQVFSEAIQNVYDLELEYTKQGLTIIVENLRRISPLMIGNSYHSDLVSLLIRRIEEIIENW